jgi:DNA modification methylase
MKIYLAGSGTTAIAAMETGRQFVAIEKEKRWYDIAVDRINGITASGQYTMFGRVI